MNTGSATEQAGDSTWQLDRRCCAGRRLRLADVDESKMITSGSEFMFSPDHEWRYFPDMTRDEILFIVFHDSDHSRAWRVLHSGFRDPTVEDAVPRHSIEVRSFAFFS